MVATAAPLQDPRLTPFATFDKTVLKNPYIFHDPTPKQANFLMCPRREALFGGAAGGGDLHDLRSVVLSDDEDFYDKEG
jgi:hypothetical protein